MDEGIFEGGLVARDEPPTRARSGTQLATVLVVVANPVESR